MSLAHNFLATNLVLGCQSQNNKQHAQFQLTNELSASEQHKFSQRAGKLTWRELSRVYGSSSHLNSGYVGPILSI